MTSELRFHTLHNSASFICLQEVLSNQLADILDRLNSPSTYATPAIKPRKQDEPNPPADQPEDQPEWSYIGIGREDGATAGEYSPILFRPSVWSVEHWSTKWLSPTPDIPSKGWDAASTRIVTIGVFRHRAMGKKALALNTHMDDQGREARKEGAKLIARLIREYICEGGGDDDPSGGQTLHVFLAGDLNSTPGQEAYRVLNSADSPVRDVRDMIPEDQWYGHEETFTGFDCGRSEPKKRIDFLFLGKEGRWRPVMYAVMGARYRGMYNSDHRAVIADVVLEGCE